VAHNVDHEEIAKFEAVASRWWDLEGEFKPLHRINPLRLGYIAERSGGLFGKKCSMSAAAAASWRSMAREGATVTGLDMGFEPLQVAKLHALESGIQVDYVQETVEEHAAKHAAAVRCGDLHGDAGARSRPAVGGARLRAAGETRRPGLLLDH
jgi:2-polyprenyl-6-hydroxyphenyl methylase/3-demethylubiquinone-9 3-methyltransferase